MNWHADPPRGVGRRTLLPGYPAALGANVEQITTGYTRDDGVMVRSEADLDVLTAGSFNLGYAWCFWGHFTVAVAGGVTIPHYDTINSNPNYTTRSSDAIRPDVRIGLGYAF